MSNIICEVWCSPARQEIYRKKLILLDSTEDCWVFDELTDYLGYHGDFFYDVFGEDFLEVGGLHKIVCKVSMEFVNDYDWEGIPDTHTEFGVDIMFKGKCSCLGELKHKWLTLQGEERMERYTEKVLMKGMDKYLEGL